MKNEKSENSKRKGLRKNKDQQTNKFLGVRRSDIGAVASFPDDTQKDIHAIATGFRAKVLNNKSKVDPEASSRLFSEALNNLGNI
ncbi:MAG: hypothetical protein RR506_07580 [Akkermansia sp.]